MALETIGSSIEAVSAGMYSAVFKAKTVLETANGKCWKWEFTGDNGKIYSGLSDAEKPATVGNKTGRWLCALATAQLVAGTQVDPDKYVGKKYMLIYVDGPKGAKMETFTAI